MMTLRGFLNVFPTLPNRCRYKLHIEVQYDNDIIKQLPNSCEKLLLLFHVIIFKVPFSILEVILNHSPTDSMQSSNKPDSAPKMIINRSVS